MDFRWKNRGGDLPNVQPNFVDPQNTGAVTADASAPFQPSGPSVPQQDFLGGVSASATRTEKLAELQELRGRLATIDAEIARVKAAPMSREKEMAVASKLAEIGDTSAYQAILARQQNQAAQQTSNTAAIDNMLFEGEKLLGGLSSKSDEERNMVRSNIDAILRRAEDMAAKQGIDITKSASYQRLKGGTEDADKASIVLESERKKANEMWTLAREGRLTDAHIKEMTDYIARHPNSDLATQYKSMVEQYAPKTRESKAVAEKRKKDALTLRAVLDDLPTEERRIRVRNLTRYERRVLEEFSPETLKTLPMG